jgi:hypothetical protein
MNTKTRQGQPDPRPEPKPFAWDRDAIDRQNREFDAVNGLAHQWRRLTLTPVVDDDYPEVRFCYEQAMRSLLDALRINRPDVFRPKTSRREVLAQAIQELMSRRECRSPPSFSTIEHLRSLLQDTTS